MTEEATKVEGMQELTVEDRAKLCLAGVQDQLNKYGFDLIVAHELQSIRNEQGGFEISVQHTQKFLPMQPKKATNSNG